MASASAVGAALIHSAWLSCRIPSCASSAPARLRKVASVAEIAGAWDVTARGATEPHIGGESTMTSRIVKKSESQRVLTAPLTNRRHSTAHTQQREDEARTTQESSPAQPAASAAAAPERSIPEDHAEGHGTLRSPEEEGAHPVSDQQTPLRQGEVYEAVVDKVHRDAVLVHLPESQREGFAPASDLRRLDADFRDTLAEGDHAPVRILKDPGSPGDVVVSLDQGTTGQDRTRGEDWSRAEELLSNGEAFEAEITGFNRGGVLVSFGELEGFVPNSHLELIGANRRETKPELVGETLSVAVLEVDQPRRRLVLSQRAARKDRREQVLSELEKGQVRTGIVRNLVDFGAFVDLGGVDGLIHISKLDWRHVDHPSDVLSVGDEVEVYVLEVDREQSRISLSRKYLLPRPWDQAASRPEDAKSAAAMVPDEVP